MPASEADAGITDAPWNSLMNPQDTVYKRFFWLAAGIGMSAIVGGTASFVSMQISLATIGADVRSMQQTIAELKSDLKESVRTRYTQEQATADRGGILTLISNTNTRVDNCVQQLAELREFKARVEAQLMGTRPSGGAKQ